MIGKPAIELMNLTLGYLRGRKPLAISEPLSGEITHGSFTCLLGPNGAGKSTLLRTLCGFQPPIGGDVRVLGRNITSADSEELAKTIAVVLTDRVDVRNLSGEELVAAGRSPFTGFWGKLSQEDRNAVREAIESVGVLSLSKRIVSSLSDGERQKVMIAKAIAQHTPVIILDEPTAFLDYPGKVEVMLLLKRLAEENGKTIFMSTHDLEIALQIADSVWMLDRKLGLTYGTPTELAANGSIGRYFDRPGVKFAPSEKHFIISVSPLSTQKINSH